MTPIIHHIGILVRDVDKAAGDYAKRFGYRPVGCAVHDPVQTAHIRFLEGTATGVLIELIAPDGAASKLAAALKKGGGLHHFAYTTQTIENDCRELRAVGMLLLQAPVPAQAFPGRRIAWLMGRDGIPIELVEHDEAYEHPSTSAPLTIQSSQE